MDYSQRTADKLMQLFKEYGPKLLIQPDEDDNSNSPPEANLTFTSALLLLGLSAEEREAFITQNDVGKMMKLELQQALKDRDQANQAKDQAILEKNLDLNLSRRESRIEKRTGIHRQHHLPINKGLDKQSIVCNRQH